MTDAPLFYSVPDAAKRLGCGRSMMYLLIDNGSIRSVKLGKRRLVDSVSLTAFAATLPEVKANKEQSCR